MKTVDDYLAELEPGLRVLTIRVRNLVRKTLPDAVEKVKMGMPIYSVKGEDVVYVANHSKHLNLGFFKGPGPSFTTNCLRVQARDSATSRYEAKKTSGKQRSRS